MKINQEYLTLNSSHKIPQLGLGTWEIKSQQVSTAIEKAFEIGYRHFDCALAYGNEPEIGQTFAKLFSSGKAKREDLFVTSKIWNTYHSYQAASEVLEKTLNDLKVQYLDMCLIHWPMGYKEGGEMMPKDANGKVLYSDVDHLETWRAMEDAVNAGKVKSIGVSNFSQVQIERVIKSGKIKPSNLQIEVHPYLPQNELIQWCKENNIVVSSYSPLASPANMFRKSGDPNLFEEPVLKNLSKKYDKTISQIVIRWHIQRGTVVLPKSVRPERIAENFDVWDNFKLSNEDAKLIDGLDKNWRLLSLERDSQHPFYPF